MTEIVSCELLHSNRDTGSIIVMIFRFNQSNLAARKKPLATPMNGYGAHLPYL